jgi:amidase
MAPTVLDTAALLQAIAGYDGIDDRQLGAPRPIDLPAYVDRILAGRNMGIKGMKIGILSEALELDVLAPTVKEAFLGAVGHLRQLGATVHEVSIPL